jgi:hypothetical protein
MPLNMFRFSPPPDAIWCRHCEAPCKSVTLYLDAPVVLVDDRCGNRLSCLETSETESLPDMQTMTLINELARRANDYRAHYRPSQLAEVIVVLGRRLALQDTDPAMCMARAVLGHVRYDEMKVAIQISDSLRNDAGKSTL